MENLAAIGAALAARHTDDGLRYAGCSMLSALPNAPTIARPAVVERLRGRLGRR